MLRWRASHYVQSTFGAPRHSFSEVVHVNCRPSARYRLTLKWHETLHQWNVRVNTFIDRRKIKTWSHICCLSYWRLAQHIATNCHTATRALGSTNFTVVPTWKHIELVAHILIGSENVNPTAGTRAWGHGLVLL